MRRLALAAATAFACNNGAGQESGFSTSITTAPPPETTSTSGTDTSTSTSTSTSSAEDSAAASSANSSTSAGPGGIPDGGTPPDGGDKPPAGCMGKIDFVFSISSSSTMKHHQDELKVSFPGFLDTLETEFADFDYHLLVPNPGGIWGIPSCEGCVDTCPTGPEDYPCGATLEPCDEVVGAGLTFSAGWDASNERCELAGGRRYITTGQPNLPDAFTCVASVGTSGVGMTAEATVTALADEINAPGGCNAGFLRDDALLVVVAIQDNYDQFSAGTAEDWADALVEAKGGDADAVVLVVISTDIDDPDGLCGYDPGTEHELRTWKELMPHSVFGSICNEQGYASYFAEAAAKIKTQCDVFAPQ